jgi:aryl-phospho-beta-D-glucosidase BglC (GH1 family)
MKTYEIKVTQDLHGYYQGTVEIEASSPKAAINKLKKMSPAKIDEIADWTHGDEYNGDLSSIEIDESSITEV